MPSCAWVVDVGTGTRVLVSYFFPLRKWDWSSDVRMSYELKERYEMAQDGGKLWTGNKHCYFLGKPVSVFWLKFRRKGFGNRTLQYNIMLKSRTAKLWFLSLLRLKCFRRLWPQFSKELKSIISTIFYLFLLLMVELFMWIILIQNSLIFLIQRLLDRWEDELINP